MLTCQSLETGTHMSEVRDLTSMENTVFTEFKVLYLFVPLDMAVCDVNVQGQFNQINKKKLKKKIQK